MGEWVFTMPDGSEYTATGDTENEAWGEVQKAVAEEVQSEFKALPWYGQAGTAANDAARIIPDALTMGAADWMTSNLPGGKDLKGERYETEKARMRAGSAALPLDIMGYGAAASVLPSAVGPAVRGFGGPGAVRAATAGTVGAAEGAALGSTESLIRGEDTGEGAESGAAGGILGQIAGGALKKAGKYGRQLGEYLDDPGNIRKMARAAAGKSAESAIDKKVREAQEYYNKAGRAKAGKKLPTKMQLARQEREGKFNKAIITAINEAQGATGQGYDRAVSSRIQGILADPDFSKVYTKAEQDAIRQINKGDLATKIARKGTKLASPQSWISSGLGGAGATLGGLIAPQIAIPLAAAVPAAGILSRSVANAGTKRNVKEAQDVLKGIKHRPDPGQEEAEKLYKLMRSLGIG